MLVRLLLACWTFLASALGPALCCCVPPSAAPGRQHLATEPVPAPCPHCKAHAPAHSEIKHDTLAGKPPCEPTAPGQKNCPCRDRHQTPVITDDAGRLTLVAVWLADLAPLADFAAERPAGDAVSPRAHHADPPPVAGVELLHRLHVLVC